MLRKSYSISNGEGICQMIGYNEVYRYSLKYALRMTTKNGFSHASEY